MHWKFALLVAIAVSSCFGVAQTTDYGNVGGTLTGSSAGLNLSGSELSSINVMSGDLGTVGFSTGALTSGSLASGGTFATGGTFSIIETSGPTFSGTFSGPVTWSLQPGVGSGGLTYALAGAVSGNWSDGEEAVGNTVLIAVTSSGAFNGMISCTDGTCLSGDTILSVNASVQSIGLPILFVHGICDKPQSFQIMESGVQAFLQQKYAQLYQDSGQYWVYYDGQSVNFEVPNGIRTYNTVLPSSRFFAVAFDDPGTALVQNFDTSRVAQISIYEKADELAHIIWKIKSITGAPRVIIVSHSMGGLVSRAYIEELASKSTDDSYYNDISTLITLDTPHGGASLAQLLQFIDLGPCFSEDSLDRRQMEPSSRDSIIPQLNYAVSGASALPASLRIYSILSYWTISTPLGRILRRDRNTDNILEAGEQDLYSNLSNPWENSQSNLFTVDNAFDHLFDLCGSVPPYVLHVLDCTGDAGQSATLVEKEVQIPAVMFNAVTVIPSKATVAQGRSVQFAAKTVSTDRAIWSLLEGPDAGSITTEGLYTPGTRNGLFHVIAIDSVKSNDYGMAEITVTP